MSLPPGWMEYKDPSTGNPYFHNTGTGETTWSRPAPAAGSDGFGAAPIQPVAAAGAAALQQPQQQYNPLGVAQPQPMLQQQPLPAGWMEHHDPATGNAYYHNPATGETTWTRPSLPVLGAPAGLGGVMGGAETWVPGIVKNWDDEKGFGFIDPTAGGDNVFVHRSALVDGSLLEKGMAVQYVLSWNAQKNKHQVAKCTGAKAGGGAPMGAMGAMGAMAAPVSLGVQEGASASGVVKTWFDDKGFGFITPSDGSKDCYVHRTFLLDGQTLLVGSTVQYTIQFDAMKNKNNATKVTGAVPGDGKGGGKGMDPMPVGPMGSPMGFGMAPGSAGDSFRANPY